jgi:excisionase family DNA binding protein
VPDSNPDELLTVPEVAKELKYTEATIRTWIKQGKLRAIRPTGREYRVRRSDLGAMTRTIEPETTSVITPLVETSGVAQFTPQ